MPDDASSISAERHVRLFRNGRNQAVRIPREFELPGEEVVMRKEGDRLVIEPVRPKLSLIEWLATREPFPADDNPFADGDPFDFDDPPPEPVEL
jgi:antitoxin VapB